MSIALDHRTVPKLTAAAHAADERGRPDCEGLKNGETADVLSFPSARPHLPMQAGSLFPRPNRCHCSAGIRVQTARPHRDPNLPRQVWR